MCFLYQVPFAFEEFTGEKAIHSHLVLYPPPTPFHGLDCRYFGLIRFSQDGLFLFFIGNSDNFLVKIHNNCVSAQVRRWTVSPSCVNLL